MKRLIRIGVIGEHKVWDFLENPQDQVEQDWILISFSVIRFSRSPIW